MENCFASGKDQSESNKESEVVGNCALRFQRTGSQKTPKFINLQTRCNDIQTEHV